jgi:3-hydroxyacyl-[acyl-carrier-protein] dehydratase
MARVKISPGHSIFDGHFPGNPVTPGVVQLQMVRELLQEHLGHPLRLTRMQSSKFLSVLNPTSTPEFDISIHFKQDEATVAVQATGKSEETIFFKLIASYEA